MPCGRLALPARAGDHVAAGIAAGGAGADIAVIERIEIDQLHRVITALLHRRNAQHHRLGPQIRRQQRIGRVAVRRDDSGVLRRRHVGFVGDGVERALILRALLVDIELIDRLVGRDHREGVDIRLLGDVVAVEQAGRGPGGADLAQIVQRGFEQAGLGPGPGRGKRGQCQASGCYRNGHSHGLLQIIPDDAVGPALEHVPQKLEDLCEENMLQRIESRALSCRSDDAIRADRAPGGRDPGISRSDELRSKNPTHPAPNGGSGLRNGRRCW